MTEADQSARRAGMQMAVGAYVVWGMLPLYFWFLSDIPAFEFVGWRIILTLPFCLLFIALRGQGRDLFAALADGKIMLRLMLSASLIGINWLIYVVAIQQGHVYAASLGYYINPLANVLAGTLFLGEKLSQRQWQAVLIAGAGVSILVWGAGEMLWVSVSLAGTFCAYGLIRKLVPVGSLPGLTIESMVLLIPAVGIVAFYTGYSGGATFGSGIGQSLLVLLAGPLTAIPLLLFAIAARRVDYSTLGFLQFIGPTITFLIGLFIFNEPLRPVQIASFIAIWIAIALFVRDLWLTRQSAS
jgi:chloramphenicol-sensitive protein RarD